MTKILATILAWLKAGFRAAMMPIEALVKTEIAKLIVAVGAFTAKWSGVQTFLWNPLLAGLKSPPILIFYGALILGAYFGGQMITGARDAHRIEAITVKAETADVALAKANHDLGNARAHPSCPTPVLAPVASPPTPKIRVRRRIAKPKGMFG